jgi:twitching motility protein PilT
MVAAYEFMVVTPGIANLIREAKTFRIDSMIQTGKKFGMQLLDDHLLQLYKDGKISEEEAVDKSKNPADIAQRMGIKLKDRPDTEPDTSPGANRQAPPSGGAKG